MTFVPTVMFALRSTTIFTFNVTAANFVPRLQCKLTDSGSVAITSDHLHSCSVWHKFNRHFIILARYLFVQIYRFQRLLVQ